METRILLAAGDGTTSRLAELPAQVPDGGWAWVDVTAEVSDIAELVAMTAGLELDPLAVRDSVGDVDLPKVDDFGHHLVLVLHGLRGDRVETYELDCLMTDRVLVTVREERSPALDALWNQVQASAELAKGGVDELLGRLADVLTRRFLAVVDAFADRIEELIGDALVAAPEFLGDMTAVRIDLAAVRRIIHPQREALDVLRQSASPLMSDAGRRRISDVFDVAVRASHELDAARSALAETLDAYRGAEAKEATNVTKVLTVYAAIMLPLSLVAGFFGMNFANLPWLGNEWGWVIVTAAMVLVATVSLGIFVALGWIRRPAGREAGAALGRGLIEAAKAPVHVGEALFEVSTMPLRTITGRLSRAGQTREGD